MRFNLMLASLRVMRWCPEGPVLDQANNVPAVTSSSGGGIMHRRFDGTAYAFDTLARRPAPTSAGGGGGYRYAQRLAAGCATGAVAELRCAAGRHLARTHRRSWHQLAAGTVRRSVDRSPVHQLAAARRASLLCNHVDLEGVLALD